MESKIFWIVELDILEKSKKNISNFCKEVFEAAKTEEKGTVSNAWYISDDFKRCIMIDHYKDDDAVLFHLNIFAERFSEKFNKYFKLTRFTVFGEPDERVKNAIAAFNPIYMPLYSSFTKITNFTIS